MVSIEEKESCEMCGEAVVYGFSLCVECDADVYSWNEVTGYYHMKSGEIVDTTKHSL